MDITLVRKEYEKRKEEIKTALSNFKNPKTENDVFYELVFTLLTPQSNGVRCWGIVEDLKKIDFFQSSMEIGKLQEFLRSRVRFHNNKAKYILEVRTNWQQIYGNLSDANSEKLREWLVESVNGHGMKEASHFLRNIGKGDLAILDRHILRCLNKLGVITEIPRSLSKSKYYEIEEKFKEYEKNIGIKIDELDLLFWSMATGRVFK